MKRREFIGLGMATGLTACFPRWVFAMGHDHIHPVPPNSQDVDLVIELVASTSESQLLEGAKTQTWKYFGKVLKGDASRVQNLENSYLGPILKLKKGERVQIQFKNELPEKSIVHWHGMDVPQEMDGGPHYAVDAGQSYVYDFTVLNRAGTYWYHPHPHERTGFQVNQGLAGLLIVEDTEEQNLDLPRGKQDLSFVIQDRRFDEKNQFDYIHDMHDRMMGLMGDQILINGLPQVDQQLQPGTYRIRLLNGSNARPYNLQWSDGRPLKIIGSDGGLLEKLVERQNVFFGTGERLEIVVDLTESPQKLQLLSAPFVPGRGKAFPLVSFAVAGEALRFIDVPTPLSVIEKLDPLMAANLNNVKSFKLMPTREYGWTIDGHPYDMHNVTDKERVKLGTMEIWEFDNTVAGMPHPIHIHGSQFQVIERTSGQFQGAFDEGWKDVVFLLPGDKVKLIKKFSHYTGDFMYHCHILEHEDMSMMRNYRVEQ